MSPKKKEPSAGGRWVPEVSFAGINRRGNPNASINPAYLAAFPAGLRSGTLRTMVQSYCDLVICPPPFPTRGMLNAARLVAAQQLAFAYMVRGKPMIEATRVLALPAATMPGWRHQFDMLAAFDVVRTVDALRVGALK